MRLPVSIAIVLVIFIAIASCNSGNNNEQVNPNTQNIILNDSSSTTGSLEVRVINNFGNPESNAAVWLYATYQDYQSNLFLFQLFTNQSGLANFGFINFGNYYIRAEKQSGAIILNNQPGDIVQVQARKSIRATVVIRN
jgi:hypothetical protein